MADIYVACSGWGINRVGMPVTAKGKRWETFHSLWVGWTFVPVLNWVAFVYVGIRAKQRKWIFWGVIYLVLWMIPGFNNTIVQWLTGILALVAWIASIAHAFLIRKDYLVRLARAKTVQGNVKGGRSTREPSEGREPDTDQPDKGMSPERTHSEGESMDEGGSRQDVGEQPSALRDYVRTPESGNHVLLPYEELFSVCAKYEGGDYYVGEAIGQKRLTNAHLHFPIPDTERVIALIDTSAFWNGKSGLALCEGGIYWRNARGASARTCADEQMLHAVAVR